MSAGFAAVEVFLLFFATGEAILHGYGSGDGNSKMQQIDDEPSFGCQWLGGMGSALECTCSDDTTQVMVIQEDSFLYHDLNAIRIRKCPVVTFGENSIKTMRTLREIELSDISELNLNERCFHWEGYAAAIDLNTPSLKVIVRNTTIKQIASYSFMGKINRIEFDKTKIENIAPFAFSSISQSQNIAFYNSHIINMQPSAFKKFSTENLNIHNSKFEYLPSRSFSDLIVWDNFMISNTNMTTVHPGAFIIDNPQRFEVTNSNFSHLDGEAFRIMTRGDVVFRSCILNTTYSPFIGISLNLRDTSVRKLIILDNVMFNEITTKTFKINTTGFDLKINNIFTQEPCDCRRITQLENDYQLESIYCFEDTPTSYQEYKGSSCSILASNATLIIVLCTALILVILIGTGLWCYFKKVYRCDKYGEEKNDKSGKLNMIVPDGRTYRETELHVIVERTDLLTTDL
nr:uncharacterized protein LOC111421063 [Onthophagus taurus]XP_022909952.1 uncharacterized protein LOC111421063 [Onthophagus taurus]XP_022909953.1 uncharacterized protein LOC111421063 [Onthophagus taurus]